ncbi:MAG: NrfD/PsrC family molybdoenzyme membrane anchor subunit [Nitriliruptor sp.]
MSTAHAAPTAGPTGAAGGTEQRVYTDADGTTIAVPTYHGRPVIKEPAWTWEVPWYLFAGGMAGASSVLVLGAKLAGHHELADRARWVAAAGVAVSPPLLIADLGRPTRFLNMLRVFKPTSVMSVGSWILASYSGVAGAASGLRALDRLPPLQDACDVVAAGLGAGMTVYTGALVADTSIPVWHEARRHLPPLFAASGLAAAGAAATLVTSPEGSRPARRAAVLGAALELTVDTAMRRHLGPIGEVYGREEAGRFHRAARAVTTTGAALVAVGGGRRRGVTVAGSALLLAGSVCTRWAVYRAGFQSARDPVATLGPQRARLVRGERTRARS